MNEKKLKAKDLVTIGVFSAVYFIMAMIAEVIMGMTPVTYIFSSALMGLLCAPIYFIAMIKIGKPLASFILLTVNGVIWGIFGVLPITISMIFFGLVTEFILRHEGYKSFKRIAVAHVVSIYSYFIGSVFMLYFFTDRYIVWAVSTAYPEFEGFIRSYVGHAKGVLGILGVIAILLFSVLGSVLAKRILSKHFKKAGVI